MTLANSRALTNLSATLLGLSIVLLLHRYAGINHDASLYLGQALHQIKPNIFGNDLFFAYGSQDSFTLMPRLIAMSHAWWSFPQIFLWGTVLGLLLFYASAWHFLSRLIAREPAYWAWLAVATLPGAYGMVYVFSYGEPFLTARPLAEALSLLALGCTVHRRWLWAGLCLLGAGLLHPLQAIGAALVLWPWLIMQDRRWLHLAWLGAPVLALGLTPIKPLNGLYQVIDPAWLKDLTDFTRQLFLLHWYPVDWANLVRDFALLGLASRQLRDDLAGWCRAAFIGLLLAITASLLLADLLHLALPTALQLWRAQWLAHLLANAAVGVLLYRDLKAGQAQRASLLALAVVMAGSGFVWTWGIAFLLYLAWPWLEARTTRLFQTTLCSLAWLTMIGLLAYYIAEEWLPFRLAHYRLDLYAIDRRILAFPLLALGLPVLGMLAWQRSRAIWSRAVWLLMLVALLVAGLIRWDARSPVARALETQSPNPSLFGIRLPDNAQVFWLLPQYPAVWVALERADYFSVWQLAGSVFNRGTPQEGRLRMERMRPVIEEYLYCEDRNVPLQQRAHCRISEATLQHACRPGTPGTPAPPDYLVLPYRQSHTFLGVWQITDPITHTPAATFWLYACPTLLREYSPSSSAQPRLPIDSPDLHSK